MLERKQKFQKDGVTRMMLRRNVAVVQQRVGAEERLALPPRGAQCINGNAKKAKKRETLDDDEGDDIPVIPDPKRRRKKKFKPTVSIIFQLTLTQNI